jgi:hypothetical protein
VLGTLATSAIVAQTDETINGCYVKKGDRKGDLRIVNDPGTCKSTERAISWNKAGPAGPPGPQGEQGPPGPAVTFDIVNNGGLAWLIGSPSDYNSGSNANPNLVLYRGFTYQFKVNAPGHPFRIATSDSGPAYNVGVTNNDVQNGTLTFKVPMDAPDTLSYYCLVHFASMKGTIEIR